MKSTGGDDSLGWRIALLALFKRFFRKTLQNLKDMAFFLTSIFVNRHDLERRSRLTEVKVGDGAIFINSPGQDVGQPGSYAHLGFQGDGAILQVYIT